MFCTPKQGLLNGSELKALKSIKSLFWFQQFLSCMDTASVVVNVFWFFKRPIAVSVKYSLSLATLENLNVHLTY